MWVFDVNTLQVIEVNTAALKRYGYSRKEFLNKTIMDFRLKEDIPLVVKILPDIRGTKTRYREFKHVAKNGKILHVEIMSYPFIFGSVNARLVIAQNIDEKKALLGRLDFTEFKLEQILEETRIGFVQVDYRSHITYWNRAAEKLIGYKRQYVKGKNLWDVFPELIGSDFFTRYEFATSRREAVEFTEYFWPVQKWFNVDIYPVPDGMIVNFSDVTAKQRVEEQLLEKINQMSELSFLNSHYIRKPVASLLGLTNLLNQTSLTQAETTEIIAHIKTCALELDGIIKQINEKANETEYFDSAENEAGDFSVNELLKQVIDEQYRYQTTHKIIQKKKTDFIYYGNKKVIALAIKNLLDNAVKFSPNANRVVVDRQIIDNNLVLSVKDFGQGIDQELLNKIFLSFIQKTTARELGVGLLKVVEAANKHNGSVWVESAPNKGATFSMRYPLSNIVKLKARGKKNADVFKNPGIEITYNEDSKCIIADWKGFHSLHSIKTGCVKLLEALSNYNSCKILNNNVNVLGGWENAVGWVAAEWFPLAIASGLKNIAWVYSASTFSRLSVDHAIQNSPPAISHKTFSNITDAGNWIKDLD